MSKKIIICSGKRMPSRIPLRLIRATLAGDGTRPQAKSPQHAPAGTGPTGMPEDLETA